ncbi:MAG: cystathionine gamma-lyase [Candidatus Polarisedimenticolia bacterium]
MHDATRVIHAGLPEPSQGAPFLPGPVFAAPYHLSGDPASSPYGYGRQHNPTWTNFENAVGQLEGGTAVVFSSGMAAAASILGSVLRPGDAVVLPSDGYYTTRMLADGFFAQFGIEVRKAPTTGNAQGEHLDRAKLLWLESPCNPGLDVCDIAALARAAHDRGALVVVDNTTATVLGQRPLSLGADFSLASDTKALTGHGDVVLGHVAAGDPAWADRLRTWRTQFGAVPGPMEVWLAHRSLGTLDVRLERMVANALAVSRFLTGRPEVRRVRYPGLPGDPAHAVAARQMSRFGPIVSFELASAEAAERLLGGCRLVSQATSFGGLHTTAERRARWGGDKVPEGFIRLSAGCEHPDDLLADLAQALSG